MGTADRPDPEQMRILARLDPETKLAVAQRLREDALALKEAWLRQCHPDETDAEIKRRLRAWQLYGRAWLD
jgi:malate synthase